MAIAHLNENNFDTETSQAPALWTSGRHGAALAACACGA